MENDNNMAYGLIESAQKVDKINTPFRLKQIRMQYEECKKLGLSDEEIIETMAVTSHQLKAALASS